MMKRCGGVPVVCRLVLVLVLLAVVAACGDDSEVAEMREGVPDVTPTALAALPEGVEIVSVVVRDGEFETSEIILQENEPTELVVAKEDDTVYRFQIGDLVTPVELSPNDITEVKFTTPLPEEYVAELLAEDEDDVLDAIPVVVAAAGRTNP